MTTLEDIFVEHTPKILSNGQIRMECPFRENHTGKMFAVTGDGSKSFFATPELNAYHCFSCKAKGRLSSLLTTRFGLGFSDALELVNIVPVERKKKEFELEFIWDIIAPKEFLARGFDKELLENHKVGYDSKGQIIIPMYLDGDLKGVKFRVEGKKRAFWYSEGFLKEEFIYNLQKKYAEKRCLLVEGETDVWRVQSYNVDWVAGLLGNSFCDFQAELLYKRGVRQIYLALDTDGVGVQAMHRIYKEYKTDFDFKFVNYPAKDPGECGRRAFLQALKNPVDYAEFNLLTLT